MSKEGFNKILKKMNQLLEEAIEKYGNDEIEEEELRKLINKIEELKYSAMSEMPDIWGHYVGIWYGALKKLDEYLRSAWSDTFSFGFESTTVKILKWAKEEKEYLEELAGS